MAKKNNIIRDVLEQEYPDCEILIADGFDSAVIGIANDTANDRLRLVYSIPKCIKILIKRDGMTIEQAEEYFEYNVQGAFMGEGTPIWVEELII